MRTGNHHHLALFKTNDTLMITYFKPYTDNVFLIYRMAQGHFILLQQIGILTSVRSLSRSARLTWIAKMK